MFTLVTTSWFFILVSPANCDLNIRQLRTQFLHLKLDMLVHGNSALSLPSHYNTVQPKNIMPKLWNIKENYFSHPNCDLRIVWLRIQSSHLRYCGVQYNTYLLPSLMRNSYQLKFLISVIRFQMVRGQCQFVLLTLSVHVVLLYIGLIFDYVQIKVKMFIVYYLGPPSTCTCSQEMSQSSYSCSS